MLCERHCQDHEKTQHGPGEDAAKTYLMKDYHPKYTKSSNLDKEKKRLILKGPKILTDASPKKAHGWQVNI